MPRRRRRTTRRKSTGKKWGKIGAPRSAKRRAHMKKIRRRR